MADGEVYIDTRLRGVDDVVKDIEKVKQQIDKLQYRMDKFKETGGDINSKAYRNMMYDAAQLEMKLEDLNDEYSRLGSNRGTDKQTESTKNLKKACDEASKSTEKLGKSVKKSNNAFAEGIKKLLKYTLGISSLIMLFRKLRQAIMEGLNNLAQFNDGVNPTNEALSNLKSGLTQLKNSLASAFAPIIQFIEPALTRLIGLLSDAMNSIGMFIASITGQSNFTKAVKVQEDYAKALGNSAKNAKKLQQYLSGLDEVKTFTSKDVGSGTAKPNEMFEVVDVTQSMFDGINFDNIISSFDNLKNAVAPIISSIGDSINWLMTNVFGPLASYTIETFLPDFFNMLASAINFVTDSLRILAPAFDDLWQNLLVPIGEYVGTVFHKVFMDIGELFGDLTEMIAERSDTIMEIFKAFRGALQLVWLAVKAFIDFVVGAFKPFVKTIINLIGSLIDAFGGIIKFLSGVFTLNFKKAWEGIIDIFKGVVNFFIGLVEGVINTVIGGLNFLSFDVPDWVPFIGGDHFGFDIPEVKFPRLATGTVVPRESREFLAVLGDNNKEAEVVSPLSTIEEAVRNVIGNGSGGSYQFTAQINRRTLFDEFISEAKMRQTTTGRNPFDLARA